MASDFATATSAPVRAVGLADRGELRKGLRTGLIRVALPGLVQMLWVIWVKGAGGHCTDLVAPARASVPAAAKALAQEVDMQGQTGRFTG